VSPKKWTRFDDYITWLCAKRGKTKRDLSGDIGHPRQYIWQIQYKPCMTLIGRLKFCQKAAEVLADAGGKLAFLAGVNPWATRLSTEDQVALWEFIERVVMMKEKGEGKPPVGMFNTLNRCLFGGLSVLDNEAVLEALRGHDQRDEETVGHTT
jgi:hypothetical protein